MKKAIVFIGLVVLFLLIVPSTIFAEEVTRDAEKYHESSYQLMNYSDTKWHEFGENTSNTIAATVKDFMWMINLIISKVVLMIVYQLFSLDIIDLTIDAIKSISSSIADGLLSTFGAFALALFSLGVIVKAYIQQNWQAFLKLLTLMMISLALLFSISSERFDYISLIHGISVEVENMVMNVNPSLTGDQDFSSSDMNTTAVALENKVFDALIYKPYLLLQYGTTNETTITESNPNRITEYLEADPRTEEGAEVRQTIAITEYDDYGNYNISSANGFSQAGYIMVMILSTVIQGVVYFFIALIRIMLQFGLVMMLLLAPFAIFLSIFPSFETVVGKYVRTLGLVVLFKGIVMFFILVAVSFISLGYDMTNTTDDLYYRIFMQIIMSVATIFLYTKRQAVMNMIEGASLSVDDMGGGALRMPRFQRGGTGVGKKKDHGAKQPSKFKRESLPKNSFGPPKTKQGGKISALRKVGANAREQSKNVANLAGRKFRNANATLKTASERFGSYQRGESDERNIYEGNSGERAAQQEVAAASEKTATSKISHLRQPGHVSPSGELKSSGTKGSVSKADHGQVVNMSSKRKIQRPNQISPVSNSSSASDTQRGHKTKGNQGSKHRKIESKSSKTTKQSQARKVVPPKQGKNLTKWESEQQVKAKENTNQYQKMNQERMQQARTSKPSSRSYEGYHSTKEMETTSETIQYTEMKRERSEGRLGRTSRLNRNE
jgi:hypothetical protein